MRAILMLLLIPSSLRALNLAEEGKKLVNKFSFDVFKNKMGKGNNDKWFFMAYSPTSRLSREVKDTFNKLAYDERGENTKFGEIDCSEHDKLCKLLRIRNYPELFMIHEESIHSYPGPYDENSIREFLKNGWNKIKPVKIAEKFPTLWEDIYSSVFDAYNRIIDVYKSNNFWTKNFVTMILLLVSSILGAVFYFLYQAFYVAKQHKGATKYKSKAKPKEE